MSAGRKIGGIIKATLVVAAVGGGIAYFALRKSAADVPLTFKTFKIDKGPVEQTVTATGQLSAVITVQVGSQVSGIIQSLGADFNSRVKAGQIVAQIEPTRIKASLEQSRAQLKSAEAARARAQINQRQSKVDFDRAKTLGERQVVGAAELDLLRSKFEVADVDLQAAEAQVAQARASVGMIKIDLERTTIRSPIDGVVLQRAVDVGQTVAASMQAPTLFTIAQDLSKMEVRAAIDEADVGKLKEGLEARFTVDAHPGREFVAAIHQIRSNPNVAQNVVTYDAILRVDNPDGSLRPGMTANVRIVTERRESVLRVANAALRFKPPPELIAPGGPRGSGGGDGPGAGGGAGGAGAPDSVARASRAPGGGREFGGGGRPMGRRGGDRISARVYKAQNGKVSAISFRPGISDEEFTEILRGPVAEGEDVVVEATGGLMNKLPAAAASPAANQNRNRGPRFF